MDGGEKPMGGEGKGLRGGISNLQWERASTEAAAAIEGTRKPMATLANARAGPAAA